ncbi:nuclease SbcCD subunit D [Spirochaetia bacterium]|nr:nuclease SbcCD subunit D [Spirochaetia bacterium]GHV39835.1 nuclease SbcCD subunit D [Spirochaetia bacterium]
MIKFLHTADLHLGKIFHEQSLIEDQRFMLEGLARILEDRSYRALIIAGDVYDRSIPSPDAVKLFGSFLAGLKAKRADLEILIIPGNHDSPTRLGFGRELFAELGIRFVTDAGDCDKPVIVKDTAGGAKGSGESCAFFLLPFLNPGSLNEDSIAAENSNGETEPLRSQSKLAAVAAARLEQARKQCVSNGLTYTVLAAHLFTAGGMESDSERIFLGSAERVDIGLFGAFDYIALGHLHRLQRAGKNGWYSGSPLAYSFADASVSAGAGTEKSFLSVELADGQARVTPLPIKPMRKVSRLSGSFDWFFRDSVKDRDVCTAEKDFLEILLTDSSITENPLALLRKRFPHLLSIKQDEAFSSLLTNHTGLKAPAAGNGERRDTAGDFEEFLGGLYGQADGEELALFRELLAEIEAEEQTDLNRRFPS